MGDSQRPGVPGLGTEGLGQETDIAVLSSSGVLLQTISDFQGRGLQRSPCKISEAMGLASWPTNGWEADSHRHRPISASMGKGWPGTQDVWQSRFGWTLDMTHQEAFLLI